MKYKDTERAAYTITASSNWQNTEANPTTVNTLFAPVQGNGINQRIGRRVEVHGIKIRGHIQCGAQTNETGADVPSIVRLILVQDMQTNATQMQGEQLMENTSAAPTNVHSFQSTNNFGRFRVLRDMKMVFGNPSVVYDGTNIEQSGVTKCFKINIKFKKPVKVHFNAVDGGTIADIVDNSFHILATANTIQMAPILTYLSRVSYKDA